MYGSPPRTPPERISGYLGTGAVSACRTCMNIRSAWWLAISAHAAVRVGRYG